MIINGELYVRRGDRDAFKILVVTACTVYAALALPFYEQIGSPSLKEFPPLVAYVFLAALFACGMASVIGIIHWRDRLEGIGMFGLSGIWAAFGVMGLNFSGAKATAFAGFLFAFAIAALWTWWQRIGRPWRNRRRARKRGPA